MIWPQTCTSTTKMDTFRLRSKYGGHLGYKPKSFTYNKHVPDRRGTWKVHVRSKNMKTHKKQENNINSDKNKTICRKGTRGKMMPLTACIQLQSHKTYKSRNLLFLKETAKQNIYIYIYIYKNPPPWRRSALECSSSSAWGPMIQWILDLWTY